MIDLAVIFLYLVGVTLLGSLAGRRLRTTQEFFLAGRRAPWWLVTASIVATETSTLTFVAVPGIAYGGDLTFLQVVMGYAVGRLIVAWLLVPAYTRGQVQTAYEVLQGRLGAGARRAAAGVFCLTRLLGDGVRLYAACLVLKAVLANTFGPAGGNELLAVVVVGGLTLVYTSIGGMRAVLWTDLIQLALYLLGGVLAFVLAVSAGGLEELWREAAAAGKLRLWDLAPERFFTGGYSLVGGLVGGAFLSTATHGTDQLIVQRLLACRSRGGARLAVAMSGVVVLAQMAFFLLLGTALWAFFRREPAGFSRNEDALPFFLVHHLPPGVSGLVLAAAFAAAMSTLSGSLNSLASATVHDFLRPLAGPGRPDRFFLRAGRLATLAWGVALMAVSLPARGYPALLDAGMGIAGITAGGVLGLFLMAGLRWRAAGAVPGLFAAVAVVALLWAGGSALHWTWYCPLGVAVSLGVAALFQFEPGRRRRRG